jgi:hypothetical protein
MFFKVAIPILVVAGCSVPAIPEIPSSPFSSGRDGGSGSDISKDVPDKPTTDTDSGEIAAPVINLNPEAIQQLCSRDADQTILLSQTVVFPARTGSCRYGEPPNSVPLSGVLSSRVIDEKIVSLPPASIVCDVAVSSMATNITYEDRLFLLLDKYVLTTDIGLPDLAFDKIGELLVWDFAKIVDIPWLNTNVGPSYCLGGAGACATGNVIGAIATSAQLAPLSFELLGKDSVKVSVVITGDDGFLTDCQHSEIPLNVEIKYLVDPNAPE